MRRLSAMLLALLLAGCAGYGGTGLKPGEAGLDDVLRVMGQPAMRWENPDGSLQLAYPRAPMGFHTYMVEIGKDGKLQKLENVMDPKVFAGIHAGMTKSQVLQILGPSEPSWTVYFKARDELVWEWRYCDEWSEAARFDVLFDGSKGTVRSTMRQTESLMGLCSGWGCTCGR